MKTEIDTIIYKVQDLVRPDITFQFYLVGSGSRKMVTRLIGGNKGYDFDYNLMLRKIPQDITPKQIKDRIREAFRTALKGTSYDDPEDSTSVLTLKTIDRQHSRIVHSFDVAILARFEDDEPLQYIHHNKSSGTYTFQTRGGNIPIEGLLDEILNFYEDGWDVIRDKYLLLKNRNNNPDKRSFNLYVEAVKNVYNEMTQRSDYQDEDDYNDYYDDDDE